MTFPSMRLIDADLIAKDHFDFRLNVDRFRCFHRASRAAM